MSKGSGLAQAAGINPLQADGHIDHHDRAVSATVVKESKKLEQAWPATPKKMTEWLA